MIWNSKELKDKYCLPLPFHLTNVFLEEKSNSNLVVLRAFDLIEESMCIRIARNEVIYIWDHWNESRL